jgi:phosphate:Na+ symporter
MVFCLPMHAISLFLVGLGLLFTGINYLTNVLKYIGSQTFRKLATKFMSPRWKAMLFGVGSGVFLQSTSAALVILASINCTGGITVPQAMAILTGFSIGNCVLPFLVSINIKVASFFVVGLSSIALYFAKSDRLRNACTLLLGLGLIFFGIETMLDGVEPIRNQLWFTTLMEKSSSWSLLTILAGAVLGFIVQSSSAVTLVAIGLTKGKFLTGPQAFLIMYGAAIGSTTFKVFLGSAFKGSGRQLVRFVNIFNYTGAGIFIILYYIETLLHVPLVMALLNRITPIPEKQTAIAFLLFNLTAAVIVSIFHTPLAAWLARSLPPTEEENLSRPKYLWNIGEGDPDTTLGLIRKEELRELEQVAGFIETARDSYAGLDLKSREESFKMLSREISSAIASISSLRMNQSTAIRHSYCQTFQTLIVQLADSMADAVRSINSARSIPAMESTGNLCLETVDFLFMYALEAIESGIIETKEVQTFYSEKGPRMAFLRAAYLEANQQSSSDERSYLLNLTIRVEKVIWLLNRLLNLELEEAGK